MLFTTINPKDVHITFATTHNSWHHHHHDNYHDDDSSILGLGVVKDFVFVFSDFEISRHLNESQSID